MGAKEKFSIFAPMESITFSFSVSMWSWILLGVSVLSMCLLALTVWPRLIRVYRAVVSQSESALPETGYPSVSVIVYAQGAGHNLVTLLPQILQQNYPSAMEVVVVNDETDDDTENIVSELALHYPNLYLTFAPDRSRSLSRRKLSITLGIKAARYDHVLVTDGHCRISSPFWLQHMASHFIMGADVVLGYCRLREADEDTAPLSRRYSWDRTLESVRWLSSALCGRPIRGTSCNVAYKRDLFFAHKGFSKSLHLKFGDDDIFIREITRGRNAAVELSEESQLIFMETNPDKMHRMERMRRDFTATMLPRRAYVSLSAASWMWWIWALCGVGAAVAGLPSVIPAIAVFVAGTSFCLTHMVLWRRAATVLDDRPLFWSVPWLAWGRPLRTLSSRMRGRRHRNENLTHVV